MGAAGGGIDVKADPGADDPIVSVAKRAVKGRTMIRVLFKDGEVTGWGFMAGLAARYRGVDADFVAKHQVSALAGDGDDDVRVVLSHLVQDARGGPGRVLFVDEFPGGLHTGMAE